MSDGGGQSGLRGDDADGGDAGGDRSYEGAGGVDLAAPVEEPVTDRGDAGQKDSDRAGRRLSLLEKALGTATALFLLATTVLGFWVDEERSQRSDLEDQKVQLEIQTDNVAEERDELREKLDNLQNELKQANEEIADLEARPESPVPSATLPPAVDGVAYLNDLEQVDDVGTVSSDRQQLYGIEYDNAVTLDLRCGIPGSVEYNVGRDYSRFTATPGLHDEMVNRDYRVRFLVETIDAQGSEIAYDEEVPFGRTGEPVNVSVEDVVRIRLVVEVLDHGEGRCHGEKGAATWADPVLHP